MPEVQPATALGEMTQRFIEFVMMHAQQAAMFLGKIPNPHTNKPEVNLDLAKLFIDQLEMIQEKTRRNLNKEEDEILSRILTDLQMTFVQLAKSAQPPAEHPHPASDAPVQETPAADQEGRKKFSKSYGA